MTVIPEPSCTLIKVSRIATSPSVTAFDVPRWIDMAVAVAGAVLAIQTGSPQGFTQLKRHLEVIERY